MTTELLLAQAIANPGTISIGQLFTAFLLDGGWLTILFVLGFIILGILAHMQNDKSSRS